MNPLKFHRIDMTKLGANHAYSKSGELKIERGIFNLKITSNL